MRIHHVRVATGQPPFLTVEIAENKRTFSDYETEPDTFADPAAHWGFTGWKEIVPVSSSWL